MGTNQKIPKGTIAIGIFLMLLIVIEVLVVTFLTPGMPVYFYSIGIFFMILGIIILLKVYRKYKSGAYIKKPPQEATVSGEEQLVTEKDLRKSYKINIAMFFMGGIMAAASAPFLQSVIYSGTLTMVALTFAMGIAFRLLGTYFIIIYKTKSEKYREILTKRKIRKMKKKK